MIGRANNILDNLIAEGKAKPMVVVMPLGPHDQSFWRAVEVVRSAAATGWRGRSRGAAAGTGRRTRRPGGRRRSMRFSKDVLDDVNADDRVVVQKFPRSPTTARFAGLSMGGGQTMNLGFNRPDLFPLQIVINEHGRPEHGRQLPGVSTRTGSDKQALKVFWIGVGKDDAWSARTRRPSTRR
jgi:enterochelin esterase family protein